ncbi:hypothetical protein A3D03_02175 [Candidatus Gottesmanbacteria bacterium RIFCSPHIGHO2_02_FULL_40_13]|uniref:Glutamyl-tRNA amidotransferase n=1 Tax=Candidatus Gottesmanbacteria bacterium RIFCSPHIGHO2_02_FULL_40_13 TaxID=1798384 RepID=A0A1F6AB07_9BACT|nr:MAG: hypothetical protein A3D03_02175 [Candidatus Gottesmanbacteria bacterium RIFCSPHIGHO2_02_FULL_40_13]
MIKNDIEQSIIKALKERNTSELKVLRFVLSEIKYAEINQQKDLFDEEVSSILQKELKKRKEAIELFKKVDKNDLVKDEEKQLTVIQRYLPAQMAEEELNQIIDQTLSGLTDTSNIGKIIGLVVSQTKGRADGSLVATLIKQKLSSA